jgi:nicotinamide riboside transporter PnuC
MPMTLKNWLVVILGIVVLWAVIGWVLATHGQSRNVPPAVHVHH